MNGVHDMGGMHGFGRIPYQENDAAFHHHWERRVWGLCQGATYPEWANLDQGRFALERMPPALYLSYGYFERWLYGLTLTLLEGALVTLDEVERGEARAGSEPRDDAAGPEIADPYAHSSYRREVEARPRFAVGERVRTANLHPPGHTRLPRYARDKAGHVHRHHGAQVLPDANAHGRGESPTHLYTVAFPARALWGPGASGKDRVFLNVWECHLHPG